MEDSLGLEPQFASQGFIEVSEGSGPILHILLCTTKGSVWVGIGLG